MVGRGGPGGGTSCCQPVRTRHEADLGKRNSQLPTANSHASSAGNWQLEIGSWEFVANAGDYALADAVAPAFRAAALSFFSQAKPASSRPKWPKAAVFL